MRKNTGIFCMNPYEIDCIEMGHIFLAVYKWVFPKIMVPPNHPLKNRVWNHANPKASRMIYTNQEVYQVSCDDTHKSSVIM